MNNLGAVYRYDGKLAEAESLATEVLEASRRVRGRNTRSH